MEIINKILLKIYMSYLNNERLYHKIKLYVFMVYCSIVALSCSITIFMTHDLTILNNILFLLSMEYLQNSHIYYDFENYYSLIDLKNNNFLKNNLLEVEKKYIFAYTKEENFLNITNDSDCENNLIQDFKDWFKKFKKQPLYLEINEKNIIKDPELFNIFFPQNLYQKNFEEDPKWDTLSDNANPDNEYETDHLNKEQIEKDKEQADQKRVKAMNPNNNTMEDLSNIPHKSFDINEIDKMLKKHESFLGRWARIFTRSPNYEMAELVFNNLSPKERYLYIGLVQDIKTDDLVVKDLYRKKLDWLYLLKNVKYFENNPKLTDMVLKSIYLNEQALHYPLKNMKFEDDFQPSVQFLDMFSQREKKYMLFYGVECKYSPRSINKIINTLDPGTRYYIRGTPFTYELSDEKMNTITQEQKSRIGYLNFLDKHGKSNGFPFIGNEWQHKHNILTPGKRSPIEIDNENMPYPSTSRSPSPEGSFSEHSTQSSTKERISIVSYNQSVDSKSQLSLDNLGEHSNKSQDNLSEHSNKSQDKDQKSNKRLLSEESGLESPFKKLKLDDNEKKNN